MRFLSCHNSSFSGRPNELGKFGPSLFSFEAEFLSETYLTQGNSLPLLLVEIRNEREKKTLISYFFFSLLFIGCIGYFIILTYVLVIVLGGYSILHHYCATQPKPLPWPFFSSLISSGQICMGSHVFGSKETNSDKMRVLVGRMYVLYNVHYSSHKLWAKKDEIITAADKLKVHTQAQLKTSLAKRTTIVQSLFLHFTFCRLYPTP